MALLEKPMAGFFELLDWWKIKGNKKKFDVHGTLEGTILCTHLDNTVYQLLLYRVESWLKMRLRRCLTGS
jgi:hypothetical protein